MKYSLNKQYITGTAIPVSALRTEASCGIGEFLDLKQFGNWCKVVGIDLIQLLPVNDTGYQSSPYSALSAFALHPIYISIKNIPEAKEFKKEISSIEKKWNSREKVHFNDVLKAKLNLLEKIFKTNIEKISKSRKIKTWENSNPWIVNYAVFSFLKKKKDYTPWTEWEEFKLLDDKKINDIYKKNRESVLFYSWVQYHLEQQLRSVTVYLEDLGINIKGDLPILMNFDSCDVWSSRDIFNTSNRAGAPPDMFSDSGQNWGFPTYNWEVMETDDYAWWKGRLKQAAKFYHAYRIDHVLGFFRIWTIPPRYESGSMGYYSPNNFITEKELEEINLTKERLTWLTEPHIPGHELREVTGLEANECIKQLLYQLEGEDLYRFKEEITSVHEIKAVEELSSETREKMVEFYHNITIMKIDKNRYMTTWFYHNSRAYQTLSDHEKFQLSELIKTKSSDSMKIWEAQGLKLLKFMKEHEDMLVCAEDLGTIPECVPEVLEKLEILGLHVIRWAKKYGEYGEPYIKPSEYNYLSVSTPAVHDSSTVRQWWSEIEDSSNLAHALNLDTIGDTPNAENIERVYKQLLQTTAHIAMFQFQDLLAIDSNLCREQLETERINVPGTTNDENWSYRLDFNLEKLLSNNEFNKKLKKLISIRG